MNSTANLRLRGTPGAAPRAIALRAGPLSMTFEPEGAFLRYVRVHHTGGETEVLRGVYAAVRDRNWGTVPARVSGLSTRIEEDAFELGFDVLCESPSVSFQWRGSVAGTPTGAVRFTMTGSARRSFLRNRIGLCVLHPITLAGAPCTIERASGGAQRSAFPLEVSPHQPFRDVRAMAWDVAAGVSARVLLEGDTFETEDQRNWTDASFKTYSTPLDLPFPVEVREGDAVRQSVTLETASVAPPARAPARPAADEERVARVSVSWTKEVALPPIGLAVEDGGDELSGRERELLRPLRLAHIRAHLLLDAPDWRTAAARAAAAGAALDAPLELAVTLPDGDSAQADALEALARCLASSPAPLESLLVFSRTGEALGAAPLQRVRSTLLCGRDVPLVAGTRAYLAQLNRNRPALAHIDGVCFSLNPQVHAFDNASLVETLPVQRVALEHARRIADGLPVRVGPVTFRPSLNPSATAPPPAAAAGELPPQVDPRQLSLFGAGWTLGSLKHLLPSGAARLTYFETTGCRGVLERAAGSTLPDRFPSRAGEVFPLYHVLADVAEFAGGTTAECLSSQPLAVEACALRRGGARCVVVANLGDAATRVRVRGLAPVRAVAVRMLDASTVADACLEPEGFRGRPAARFEARDGELPLDLGPCALARLDLPAEGQP